MYVFELHSHMHTHTHTHAYPYPASQSQKVFLPHETEQFVRLFRFGLVALDIYRVTILPNNTYILRSSKYVPTLSGD